MNRENYFRDLGNKKVKHFSFDYEEKINASDLSFLVKYCTDLESIELPQLPLVITNQELNQLHLLPNLQTVIIEFGFCLSDECLMTISSLKNLKKLILNNCNISREFIVALSQCKNLNYLALSNSDYLLDEDLKQLTEIHNLEHLIIFGQPLVTDDGLIWLKLFSRLKEISLGCCGQISDLGMVSISSLPNLSILDLEDTPITDKGLEQLQNLPNLRILNLNHCHSISDKGVNHLTLFKNLEQLGLRSCWKVTDEGLKSLTHFDQIKYLDLSDSELTNETLNCISAQKSLIDLDLRYCDNISESGFNRFHLLGDLFDLDLSYCSQINDKCLEYISTVPRLKTLNLCGCQKITNKGLQYISQMNTLKKINLNDCDQLSDEGILDLVQSAQTLSEVYLKACKNVSGNFLDFLGKNYPSLKVTL